MGRASFPNHRPPDAILICRRVSAINTPSEPIVAAITGWRVDYRFTNPATVDILLRLTVDVHDASKPLVAGASLYASGDNTPAALLPREPGRYIVPLPIRGQQVIPWQPYRADNAANQPKRYLINFKLTQIPEDSDDPPIVVGHQGVTLGFRTIELIPGVTADAETGLPSRMRVNGAEIPVQSEQWATDTPISASAIREQLTQLRETGVNLIRVSVNAANTPTDLYSLCTTLGLLICQELPATTPGLALETVRRLRSFPALALWRLVGGDATGNAALATDIAEEAPGSPVV